MDSLLARLTRVEDQLKTGEFTIPATFTENVVAKKEEPPKAVSEPIQDAWAVPQKSEPAPLQDEAPVGFWSDVASAVRKEVNVAISGFFGTTPNAPVKGVLAGETLTLVCANKFVMDMVNKPEILALVARKAAVKLGRSVRVVVSDQSGIAERNAQMEQLLDFGRAHSNVINIKE